MIMDKRKVEQLMEGIRGYVFGGSGEAPSALLPLLEELLGKEKAQAFQKDLPEIQRLLLTDVEAIAGNDPAASDREEIIACYPGVTAMLHYRTAHCLYRLGIPILPRFITELAHSATGIDIHPAARIGEYFAIDHGTGIVIGATAVVGSHVMLYQGVTLGARNFRYDEKGHPLDVPRHPLLEDNVTVYSNTSILGNVRIGHDTIIGGNVWLTHDVPPHSKIQQGRAIYVRSFENGEGI
ncbi:MAG: serine acetyltransferase [Bacteroidales bacterium]|nr:serine acetyltransferase [Bacteroidales bacterium]